ncbi:MAG: two component transcriptional regulator, LuxR family [Verrucomicrobia bacterium]|nr:two component transcriptional regulator, LuxR family [Verrucomicrobiota bacterium]
MNTPGRDSRPPIRVLVAEDHPIVLEGLVTLLSGQGGFSVEGSATDRSGLRTLTQKVSADVLLMDLMLRDDDGLALIKELVAQHPPLRILVFSLQPESNYAERCLRAGARGYLMKQEPVETLFAAIRTVAAGSVCLSPRMAAALLGTLTGAARKPAGAYAQLTDRELQVFRLIGLGKSSREAALQLGISSKTVEAHRENIKNKLGLDSAAALVARAAVWVREGERN